MVMDSGSTLPPPDEKRLLQQKAIVEAALFQHRESLSPIRLAKVLGEDTQRAKELLEALLQDYADAGRGLTLRQVAGGYVLLAKPECLAELQPQLLKPRPPLSQAALETLALIAYRQPVTAAEIMAVRQVHTAGVLQTLLDRKLIRTAGRRKSPGHPIVYRTTPQFLLEFGLEDLDNLPPLERFQPVARSAGPL